MRYMGDATNPLNLPGLPGYDPTKPTVIGPPVAPAAPGVPSLPSTGAPMDPTVKATLIAQVPALSTAQQQDLYDIGNATAQASTARYMAIGAGAAGGIVVGWFARRLLRKR